MLAEPKYAMGFQLHYMHENKAVNSHVRARVTVEHPEHIHTQTEGVKLELRRLKWTAMEMKDRIVEDAMGHFYITRHGIIAEADAYPTKQHLLDSL